MGFNFRKSFKIAPGVRLNVSKKGVTGVSVGGKGARVTVGKKAVRSSVSAPGTGVSYSKVSSFNNAQPLIQGQKKKWNVPTAIFVVSVFGFILFLIWFSS
ncbi:DUF4236 domain-containing protein [Acinetobacter sp. ANC 5033]|uniref:DUF4236 domain-containing protein n=1 Tax=Acinetobacter amyesii TaxID=2942470 RepID=UPI00201B60DA|nr:DUF4236 domain-containing protein [Acinetobacter amyesii]MCL6236954.1 DUF4236 domain-containing protein [Acinetobacter amyesii]